MLNKIKNIVFRNRKKIYDMNLEEILIRKKKIKEIALGYIGSIMLLFLFISQGNYKGVTLYILEGTGIYLLFTFFDCISDVRECNIFIYLKEREEKWKETNKFI